MATTQDSYEVMVLTLGEMISQGKFLRDSILVEHVCKSLDEFVKKERLQILDNYECTSDAVAHVANEDEVLTNEDEGIDLPPFERELHQAKDRVSEKAEDGKLELSLDGGELCIMRNGEFCIYTEDETKRIRSFLNEYVEYLE
jgi:hypothetical protein